MNTLTPVSYNDVYEERRADVAAEQVAGIENFRFGSADTTATATAMPTPVLDQNQLQGSQNIEQSPVLPDLSDVANEPSDEYKAEMGQKKKGIGAMDVLSWATSPLVAFGDAAIAPIADKNYPGTGFVDDAAHAFKVSGKALMKRLLPELGEEAPDYGAQVVEKHLPELPDWIKPTVAMGLEMVTDPTVTLSIGGAKVVQEGLKAKKLQAIGKEELNNKGVLEEGITRLLGFDKGYDPNDLSKVGQLAAKADRGDKEAFKELELTMKDQRFNELTNAVDIKATQVQLDHYKNLFGDEKAPLATFEKATDLADRAAFTKNGLPNMAININLSKLNSTEDVDALIHTIGTTYEKEIKKSIGDPHTQAFLQEGMQKVALEDLLGRRVDRFNDVEALKIRGALIATGNKFRELAKMAKAANFADDTINAAAHKAFVVNYLVQEKVHGVASSAGRLLNVFKRTATTSRGMYQEIDSIVNNKQFMDGHFQRVLHSLAADDRLDNSQLQKFLDKSIRSTQQKVVDGGKVAYDAVYEIFVNSWLSGALTHAKNLTSNAAMLAYRPTQKYLETLSAGARGLMGNESASLKAKTDLAEANAMLVGMVSGTADAFRIATGRATKAQVGYPEELMKLHEIAKQRVNPKITAENFGLTGNIGRAVDFIGGVIRMPGEALLKEDKAFKLINYRMTVNQEAAKRAWFMGQTPADQKAVYNMFANNPDEYMKDRGIDMAELYTFSNRLGEQGMKWERAFRTPGMNLLVPFFRAPMNIVKFGVRNSFVGSVWNDFLSGDFMKGTPMGDVARANLAVSTLLPASILAALSDDGDIRVTGARDTRTEAGRLKSQEDPPYSIIIGDKAISYEGIEPMRSILGMLTNYKETATAVMYDEGPEAEEMKGNLLTTAITPFLQTIRETPFFDVFGELHWILDGASRGDYDAVTRKLEDIGMALVSPNFAAQTNRAMFDEHFRMADTFLEKWKSRIWGMPLITKGSTDLPIRPDAFGDPQFVPRGTPLAIINPFLTRNVKHDKIAKEMIRLGVDIPRLPEKFSLNGIELKLNTQQRSDFGVLVGRGIKSDGINEGIPPIKESIENIINHPDIKRIQDEALRDKYVKNRVEFIYQQRREMVKRYMVENYPDLKAKYEEVAFERENAVMQDQTIQ